MADMRGAMEAVNANGKSFQSWISSFIERPFEILYNVLLNVYFKD